MPIICADSRSPVTTFRTTQAENAFAASFRMASGPWDREGISARLGGDASRAGAVRTGKA